MRLIAKRINYLMFALISTTNILAQDTIQVITSWVKQNSVPLKYIEPGKEFSDLQPLKETLKVVSVIGLGEGTHGTHEFFQMKHRIIEFLVKEMNFNALVLESSFAACQPINDYVLYGKGDRATVLTGQGYTPWDNEEFSILLDWIRAYNQTVSGEKKVRFYGMDLCYNVLGRERVLAYLKKYGSEKLDWVDSLFQILSAEEEKWPTRLDQVKLMDSYVPLEQVITYFNTNKTKLIAASSADEWGKVYQHLKVMEYWVLANLKNPPPTLTSKKLDRGSYMGQNMRYIIDKEKPNTKFIIWAYNDHIAIDTSDGLESIGAQMRKRLGDKYYAMALTCYQGTFQTSVLLDDNYWGALKIDTIPLIEKSLNWYLFRANKKIFFIDFRSASSNAIVEKWMETSQTISEGYSVFRGASLNRTDDLILKNTYDGILYIEQSNPVHPTRNALARTSKNIGF